VTLCRSMLGHYIMYLPDGLVMLSYSSPPEPEYPEHSITPVLKFIDFGLYSGAYDKTTG
jgi:hypothetical protein